MKRNGWNVKEVMNERKRKGAKRKGTNWKEPKGRIEMKGSKWKERNERNKMNGTKWNERNKWEKMKARGN